MKLTIILFITLFSLAGLLLTGCSDMENSSNNKSAFPALPNYQDSQSAKTTYIYADNQLIAKVITIDNDSHIDYMIP